MTYPDAPTTLTEVISARAADSITFTWVDGQYNNGAAVTSYRVSMSEGSGDFDVLDSEVLVRQYQATQLTPGATYNFKVEALNKFGYSVFSSTKSILCATSPSKLALAPITSVSTSFVTIDWETPTLNGLPITSYSIFIRKGD